MELTPPKIIGRLTPCSSAVLVRNQLSGSLVEIFADDVKVGGKSTSGPDDFVVLDTGVTLTAGAKITTKQTLGSDASLLENSVPVIVHSSPSTIGGINFPTPLHVCGECVFVDGVEPGAIVDIMVAGSPHGHYEAKTDGFYGPNGDGGVILLHPQIGNGDILQGQQTACNIHGPITQSAEASPALVVHREGPLSIPTVKEPLKECEQMVKVGGVLEGSMVTLNRSEAPSVSGYSAFSNVTFPLNLPLKAGESITARQELPKCGLVSENSSPPAIVQIRDPLRPPIVISPLCSGATSVRLADLYKGSKVRIFKNDANPIVGQTPEHLLQNDSCDFTVGPLTAGEVITAQQELCDIWSNISNSVTVDSAPLTVLPVTIPGPLYECATMVRVRNIRAGAIVHIFNTQAGSTQAIIINANPQEVYYSSQADIRVYPALKAGDVVYAVQIGCNITSDKSNQILVQGHPGEPNPPSISTPLDSCNCEVIPVTNVIPGAQVDVFVNDVWFGSSYAADSASVRVPIAGCLLAGDLVKARQRLCNRTSSFGTSITVSACPAGISIGPTRINDDRLGAVGKLFSMAIDPTDTSTMYVGSGASGVWKTTDGGNSWAPVADSLPTLEIAAIAIDSSNSSRIYVVTAHNGVFRSDNAGNSWTLIYGNDLNAEVPWGTLLINPANTNVLYLTSSDGIYRSSDGGMNWQISKETPIISGGGPEPASATDLVMDPSNPSILYAAIGKDGIYKTTDGGITGDASWTRLGDSLADSTYIRLALRRETPNVLYALYILKDLGPPPTKVLKLFRTTDGGASWSLVSIPDFYGAPIAVTPINQDVNQDIVYIGGLSGRVDDSPEFHRSIDGGQTFSVVTDPHVDHHRIVLDPVSPNTIYTLCDGGIYKSINNGALGSWSFLGNGLANVEFYDIANSVTNPNLVIGGTQDNGTIKYDGNSRIWNQFYDGDGSTVAIDPTNDQILYFMNQDAFSITRSFDGGNSKTRIGLPVPEHTCNNLHFQVHPSITTILLASCGSLWRSTTQGSSWSQIFSPSTGAIVRSAVDPSVDLYYAGSNQGVLFAAPSGENWQNVFNHPTSRKITDIEVDPQDPNTLYVSFSGTDAVGNNRIFRLTRSSPAPTTMTAHDITSFLNTTMKLPFDRIVQTLSIDRNRPLTVYAGTNKGLYRGHSEDGGTTWSWILYGSEMSLADIRDLEIHPTTSIMRVGTFGRGAYQINID
jgi:photosystem II stability/assembly factor-like uncharacterized protein